MTRLLVSLLFTLLSSATFSQKLFFIYIQSESEQPFFVKMGEKVHSSSPNGYIILSRLVDSTHSMTIGFPQNKWPDQQFRLPVNNRDQGFLLKNFPDKGWGLFDLQRMTVMMSMTVEKPSDKQTAMVGKVSEFTEILARAADDPSLRERPIIQASVVTIDPEKKELKTEEKTIIKPLHTEPVVTEVKIDKAKTEESEKTQADQTSIKKADEKETKKPDVAIVPADNKEKVKEAEVIKKAEEVVKNEEKKEEATKKEIAKEETKTEKPSNQESVVLDEKVDDIFVRSNVTQRSEASTTEGHGIVFVDKQNDGRVDTIRIMIPNSKPLVTAKEPEKKEEKRFIEINTDTAKAVVAKPAAVVASNCKEQATETDFIKLRKKMALADGDEDMLGEARKYFKLKCFTTAQIRSLGSMFLNDGARYKFYDLGYAYVSDGSNYPSLQSEITDPYYVNRFRAMLK